MVSTELYSIIWTAVRHLLEIDVHVVCFVSDGSAVNRKFYQDHRGDTNCIKDHLVFKTRNVYEMDR